MKDIRDDLLDIYVNRMGVAELSFEMMGRMLDAAYMKKRLSLLNAAELYIYGGGYLGIQFYRGAKDIVKIPAIIDKRGRLAVHCPEIPVLTPAELEKVYKGQKIIVASVKFYSEIRRELSVLAGLESVLYLGELLEGDIW